MNPSPEIFNSKLLLFGEYGLMFGAMALSMPFTRFSGSLEYDSTRLHEKSTSEIGKFFNYLASLRHNSLHYPFKLNIMEEDLDKGVYFNSNIPLQYGLGSSGALVAALFSRYAAPSLKTNEMSIDWLKADFALLESYFHGKSSGLDPLVSFLNCGILLDPDKGIQTLTLDLAQTAWTIALVDTKTTGATGPLVQHFIEHMKLPDYNLAFYTQYLPANNGCIQSLRNGDQPAFFSYLNRLIQFELQHFGQMIPDNFDRLIRKALDYQVYIKLLGSGGGGYLLAFAPNENILNQWSKGKKIQLLNVK